MNTQMGDALRKSLDEVDLRHKVTMIIEIVFSLTFASVVVLTVLRAHDTRTLLAYGLVGIAIIVAGSTIQVARLSHDNTRRILKAIEMLSQSKEH